MSTSDDATVSLLLVLKAKRHCVFGKLSYGDKLCRSSSYAGLFLELYIALYALSAMTLTPRHVLLLSLILAFVTLSFLRLLLPPSIPHPLSTSGISWSFLYRSGKEHAKRRQELDLSLERVLRRAALPDRTVIITTLNEAWTTPNNMVDLFLESLRTGEGTERFVDHLVIVALDQKTYDRCIFVHVHCFQLRTEGVDFSGVKAFRSSDYVKMMWRRIQFLREVLEEGYSFVFTDADILWFRDPFPLFSPEADLQIACDFYNGRPKSLKNNANGGFVFTRSNKRTIQFYKYWHKARELFPDKHDQDVFDKIKHDEALADMGLRVSFLDTKYISGFCQPRGDLVTVCTMHANCCYDLESKLQDLRLILSDWRKFRSMSPQEKRVHKFSWSAPKACLLSNSSSS